MRAASTRPAADLTALTRKARLCIALRCKSRSGSSGSSRQAPDCARTVPTRPGPSSIGAPAVTCRRASQCRALTLRPTASCQSRRGRSLEPSSSQPRACLLYTSDAADDM
eukprot:6907805-Prymnesium_polylepis.1